MDRELELVENYKSNKLLVDEFIKFTDHIFPSISFKKWVEKNLWPGNYIPFSLMKDGRIISNVCISEMVVFINGKSQKSIQFSAVGTLPEYRGKGLSKKLMQHVLERFQNTHQFFFLYANDSVIDYYPKFGFRKLIEHKFLLNRHFKKIGDDARRLDLNNAEDYKLITDLLANRKPLTKIFGAEEYSFITMWHLYNIFFDDCYYLDDENLIIIMKIKGSELHLYEIIFQEKFMPTDIIPKIIPNDTERIYFYFPPDQIEFDYDIAVKEDTMLYVLAGEKNISSPFRFPITAAT